jgi:hypothetical protein
MREKRDWGQEEKKFVLRSEEKTERRKKRRKKRRKERKERKEKSWMTHQADAEKSVLACCLKVVWLFLL